ncbi:MAG: methionine synthase [Bacteroidales bacterium]|nr:methionine synthase [Candidatus Equibacterium intestinale]
MKLSERILLLDGAFGTMVQKIAPEKCAGRCSDLLNLSDPDIVGTIHRMYLEAGADIIECNSFNSNAVSLSEYGMQDHAYQIARRAAEIAVQAVRDFNCTGRKIYVAGTMGPTNRTASIAATGGDSGVRDISFDTLAAAYYDQARGLADGGADIILIETIFDTLNAKAAIFAIKKLEKERGIQIPTMISVTLAEGGRTLSGQTLEAFWASVTHARPISVGLNCSFGAKDMLPHLERLAAVADVPISVHPNAGLPNLDGGYDETPESFAEAMEPFAAKGLVNIMGGCCGTTPEFIKAIGPVAAEYQPRPVPEPGRTTVISGLEPLRIVPEANFINIGERTNVAGSAKFARLIREGSFAEALGIARAQVYAGAQAIDICMDDGLIDGPQAMSRFINMITADMEIARVPLVIDSSDINTIEAGLKVCPGKPIVNSISLKEGEQAFLEKASLINAYGAAVVVMLFDEKGQAVTFERKIEVAERAYRLLTDSGFPAEDIIFDPNILAVATGIPEHDRYALDFINATRWIKENLPFAKVSGGVSNLSFAFRGNNTVREAMHSAFLYHAHRAGMDMGIVNPQMLKVYTDIEPELLEKVEDVILCRRPDAAQRLADYAAALKERELAAADGSAAGGVKSAPEASLSTEEKIELCMVKGISDTIETDVLEMVQKYGSPIAVIDNILMPAMEKVGRLFGEGKMFLPQVIKTASVMKQAVAVLSPLIEGSSAGRHDGAGVVTATVKGDIHDIGKNIVSVVLTCNGYNVTDLGVMVEPAAIVKAVKETGAGFICLSALITPSLAEMANTCRELARAGIDIPVIVGGATTSPTHTAVKLAPEYPGLVVYSANAAENVRIINSLTGRNSAVAKAQILAEQKRLREDYQNALGTVKLLDYDGCLKKAESSRTAGNAGCCAPEIHRFNHFDIQKAASHIDWNMFYAEWGEKSEAGRAELKRDALQMLGSFSKDNILDLQGVVGKFPVTVEGDDIIVAGRRMAMLRNQTEGARNISTADAAAAAGHITLFAVSAGVGLAEYSAELLDAGCDYHAFMAKMLADRLAEGFAEEIVPAQPGERIAFGYPTCPDHSLKKDVFEILDVQKSCAFSLTENYMINPAESICGIVVPGAEFFSVGKISEAQLESYAGRRGLPVDTVRKLISKNL